MNIKVDINPADFEIGVIMARFPWILLFNIEIRRNWFSNCWKTRGSNFLEIQLWIFKISIGMPWVNDVLIGQLRDYGSLDNARKTNDTNLTSNLSFQIGKYIFMK